ncbi:M23 family metallopeptidase [Microbacterium natoriense]|uniref:M23 family metallopeptidase n=1 Tax=Microbacterium natoriense TaxID=284570 RepID=UPI0027D8B802|nr:M23 family metallopeptidase [Microbacterium natoriense]
MPTRRSSRHRTAVFETPAVTVAAEVAAVAAAAATAPVSRRAARQRPDVVEPGVAEVAAAEPTAEPVAVEPVIAESVVATPVADEAPAAPEVPLDTAAADPFVQASLTFRSVVLDGDKVDDNAAADDAPAEGTVGDAPVAEHVARRRPQFRKVVTFGATVGVMGLAGLLAVSMTMPAEAIAATGSDGTATMSLVAASSTSSAKTDGQIQAFVTSSDVQNETLARAEDFSTVSLVDLASEQGIKFSDSVFTNDPDAAIQWPFLVGVSMSSGYGPRWGRMHEGIDFTPGEGAPIQAIADGTVRIATEQGGGYGVTVYIDHVIDGQVITSHYSHMQYGSLKVKAGDTVKVGDIVGDTGNTGHSFGAHLHFEIIVNGKTIDPLPWLRTNAGRASLD